MKVLVIDDDPVLRSVLAETVTLMGFKAMEVDPGAKALRAVKAGGYDLLITEVVMPGIDGVELVRAARRANPGCAIIAISGGSRDLPAAVGLKLAEAFGADAVLYKPFSRSDLISAISAILRKRA